MANLAHLPDQWRKSGLTQREFCRRRDISLATFSYWRGKQLHGESPAPLPTSPAPAPSPTFARVIVEPNHGADVRAIEITYPDGTTVRIPVPPGC